MSLLPVSTLHNKNLTQLKLIHPTEYRHFPGPEFVFGFELQLIDQLEWVVSFAWNHPLLPFVLCLIYYLTIEKIQQMMEHREPFRLRGLLVAWNTLLALFSILGTVRLVPELIWAIKRFGLVGSTCADLYFDDPRQFLWMYLFGYSKVFEFGDTLFIVLRKQRLITLHWVHHILTLLYCWYALQTLPGSSRWFSAMNALVHSLMYAYYAVMATGFRIPKKLALYLTLLQIGQMGIGTAISVNVLRSGPHRCPGPRSLAWSSLAMYFLFFVLFAQFFIDKYHHRSRQHPHPHNQHQQSSTTSDLKLAPTTQTKKKTN